MADVPADLSPFRSLVSWSSGGYFALVTLGGDMAGEPDHPFAYSWIEFLTPALGNLGIMYEWEYPVSEFDFTKSYCFWHDRGSNAEKIAHASYFLNLGLMRSAFGLESVEFDFVYHTHPAAQGGNAGFVRAEVYRGPLIFDAAPYLDAINPDQGSSLDDARVAWRYKLDEVIGRTAEAEVLITISPSEGRVRGSIPVADEVDTPTLL